MVAHNRCYSAIPIPRSLASRSEPQPQASIFLNCGQELPKSLGGGVPKFFGFKFSSSQKIQSLKAVSQAVSYSSQILKVKFFLWTTTNQQIHRSKTRKSLGCRSEIEIDQEFLGQKLEIVKSKKIRKSQFFEVFQNLTRDPKSNFRPII